MTRIELDEPTEDFLAQNGYELDSVPERGDVVSLRRNANLSTGGTAEDVTDEVHPDNRSIAERAAKRLMESCGASEIPRFFLAFFAVQ